MDYSVRRSRRARHVWLRLAGSDELVVTVPQRFDVRRVPGIIESNREWIRRTVERLASRRSPEAAPVAVSLPRCISLSAAGRDWAVEYRETNSRRVAVVERTGSCLLVSGAVSDHEACRRALLRWLRRTARAYLSQLLLDLAAERGFAQPRVMVRSQRTRWASCSRGGTISLNLRLLFVAPALMRHVMLHELCHLTRMDHSKAFWTLLERHDPDWREHRRMLRAAWSSVPDWVTSPIPSHP